MPELSYDDGKRLETRYRNLLTLKIYQNCSPEQCERIDEELSQIRNILPSSSIEKIDRDCNEKKKHSTEEKTNMYINLKKRLEEHPNWADFHLLDLLLEQTTVRDGELLNNIRDLRWKVLDKRPLPDK